MTEEDLNAEMMFFYVCLGLSFLYSIQRDTRNMLTWLLFALFFMVWDVRKDDARQPKVP